jgi:chemotaxis protein MotB
MVTLLMALFLVLFAMSNVDKVKFALLAQGLAEGFGEPEYVPLDGGDGVLEAGDSQIEPVSLDAISVAVPAEEPGDLEQPTTGGDPAAARQAQAEAEQLTQIAERARAALDAAGLVPSAEFRIDERGLIIALLADDLLFDDASAELKPAGAAAVEAVAPVIAELDERVDVEGHANHLPLVRTAQYPTNWELSAARAASVVRHLVERDGIDASRLRAVGYSDTRPLVPPEDPAAIERNRRVDVVLVSDLPTDVRALLPQYAGGLSPVAGG